MKNEELDKKDVKETKPEVKKPTLVEEFENDLRTNEFQLIQTKAKIFDMEDELEVVKNNAKTIEGIILALKAIIDKSKKE
jgi:hypothetical protein